MEFTLGVCDEMAAAIFAALDSSPDFPNTQGFHSLL